MGEVSASYETHTSNLINYKILEKTLEGVLLREVMKGCKGE